MGIYAEDLAAGKQYAYQADELFPTASVFKVAVMIELFQRAERIELLLDDRRTIAKGISHHGTGKLKGQDGDPERTLLEYCRLMIAESDNVATDTLMETLSPAAVTATLRKLGFPKTNVAGNCTEMHYQMAGIDSRVGSPRHDELLLTRARTGNLIEAGFADSSPAGNVTTPEGDGDNPQEDPCRRDRQPRGIRANARYPQANFESQYHPQVSSARDGSGP